MSKNNGKDLPDDNITRQLTANPRTGFLFAFTVQAVKPEKDISFKTFMKFPNLKEKDCSRTTELGKGKSAEVSKKMLLTLITTSLS